MTGPNPRMHTPRVARKRLTGPEWFQKWQGDRPKHAALLALAQAAKLNLQTVYRACVHGLPVQVGSARMILDVAGDALTLEALVDPGEPVSAPRKRRSSAEVHKASRRRRGRSTPRRAAASGPSASQLGRETKARFT